jgi:hypothetical protein
VSASVPIPTADGDLARRRVTFTVVAAFTAIAAAQLGDLGTFLHMISIGGLGAEANPLVVHIARTHGFETLLLLKLALIPFVALIVAALMRIRVRLAATVLTFATLAGLVGACSNVAALA